MKKPDSILKHVQASMLEEQSKVKFNPNFFGHDKENPRSKFLKPEHLWVNHFFLKDAFTRLDEYFNQTNDRLVSLAWTRETQKRRNVRSDGRESIILACKALVSQFCLGTESVAGFLFKFNHQGDRVPHEFVNYSHDFLKDHCNLSMSRFQRAIFKLKEAGYLKIRYRCKKEGGKVVKYLTSIKNIESIFWEHLGFAEKKIRKVATCAKIRYDSMLASLAENKKTLLDKFRESKKLTDEMRYQAHTIVRGAVNKLAGKEIIKPYVGAGKARFDAERALRLSETQRNKLKTQKLRELLGKGLSLAQIDAELCKI